ncbi:MAG: anaerobic ribonucleoside-triphosphate reductase activating protein [Clostridia bacterium]|nr:anaerobic ribonucleoside-triphosphate reductase activating protein [Clostridia bacterium]
MIRVAGIARDSIVDGPGIRTTVFVQGCPHHCPGCQNPETWPFDGGTEMSPEAIFESIRQNPLCRGVTFSGGEPFAQAEALLPLADLLKAAGYELASYTGYTFERLLGGTPGQRQLLQRVDVLIDGPFLLSERSLDLNFRGSRNQRVLSVPLSLAEGRAIPETSPRWLGEY